MKSSLYERYTKEIAPVLGKELGIKNSMQLPQIEKVCVNAGIGSYMTKLGSKDTSLVEENISKITGRKPIVRKARMAVSNFKLRQGMPVGVNVTLRGQAAYNFLDRLIHVVYPRVRDFRGVSRNIFDKEGNCSLGFNDYTVFPEVTIPEDSRKIHGLEVTVVFKNSDPEHSRVLLEKFDFPFKKAPKAKEETPDNQ